MSDVTRWTTSDAVTKSDVSKNTKSDVSKNTKSDVTKTTKSDVSRPGLSTFSQVARRMLPSKGALSQKGKVPLSLWRGQFGRRPGEGGVFGAVGGGDRLAKTVNALRAAVRFRGPGDPHLADAYRLDPSPECHFQSDKVKKLLQVMLETRLEGFRYDGRTASSTILSLSRQITDEVKAFEFPRYKLVCNVIMGQVEGQDIQISSRCLWNSFSDSYACVTHQTPSYFVVALVHATYHE